MAMKGGFKINGIPMHGAEMTTGSVFFVDSVTGLAGNSGLDILHPLATVDQATNKCTANKGDIVYLMPNHAETMGNNTTWWAPDVAGVTYIGLGSGSDMPTFTGSGTSSEITIGADNITFKNLRFEPGIDAVLVGIDVNAHYFTMEDCVMDYGTDTYDWVDMVSVDSYDYAVFKNNKFLAQGATAGSDNGIEFIDAQYIQIVGNQFYGDFAIAPIGSPSGTASAHILIDNNFIYNDDTGNADNAILLAVAATGLISNNTIMTLYDAESGALIDPGSCGMLNNHVCHKINTYSLNSLIGTAAS